MMRKPAAYLFAILVGAIIWFFFQHFKIEGANFVRVVPKSEAELNATDDQTPVGKPVLRLPQLFSNKADQRDQPGEQPSSNATTQQDPSPIKDANLRITPAKSPETIRVASFHLHHFGAPSSDPALINLVARVVQSFDVVALQGIRPTGSSAVLEVARRAGKNFEAILAPQRAIVTAEERFAFILNRDTIVADRGDGLYTLIDQGNRLDRDPLIGWFRAKAAPENEAFTFTLVNVNVSRSRAAQELDLLDDAFYAIRDDGRDEDDVILLGCFQTTAENFGELNRVHGLYATFRGVFTDLLATSQTQNIVFQTPATDEFTGKALVYNYVRAFDLTSDQAGEISDYFPVWAEFSIYEGGQRGRIARRSQ